MDLSELRKEIDAIDDELVRLFCQRMDVASKVADYKKATGSPIYHPGREQEVLQKVAQKAGPEMENYARVLYSTLFELSRSYQKKRNGVCAELYDLNSQGFSVHDKVDNRTGFISISNNLAINPGADKTGIMMILPHKPGALYKVLARMYILGINVAKLESRPIPDCASAFMFFFDLDTSICSEECIQLICELDELCEEFEYLGSYTEVV